MSVESIYMYMCVYVCVYIPFMRMSLYFFNFIDEGTSNFMF